MRHNLVAVDKGALNMALNVLSRGTDVQKEVGEELRKTLIDISDMDIKNPNKDITNKEEIPHYPV